MGVLRYAIVDIQPACSSHGFHQHGHCHQRRHRDKSFLAGLSMYIERASGDLVAGFQQDDIATDAQALR
ncbi:hypothetical protein BK654_25830 [Pseudomonas brassicacearum]|nr:hypothetical protein BK654_25830 [Pseudomonas brassicacearum]